MSHGSSPHARKMTNQSRLRTIARNGTVFTSEQAQAAKLRSIACGQPKKNIPNFDGTILIRAADVSLKS